LSSFGLDAQGELYLGQMSSTAGPPEALPREGLLLVDGQEVV